MKDYTALVEFLKKKYIEPDEAAEIFKRAIKINPTNQKSVWKMQRFTLYIWQRLNEYRAKTTRSKIDTIRKVVASKEYKNLYKTFPLGSFNPDKEVRNLNKLLADPRQYPLFKAYNFVYKGTNKNIPQDILDKIR